MVELFTSQGCSSCPPADAYLHKLAAREDVIALALHVDYWDYIGWKDSFGKAEWSDRQRGYAKAAGRGMVYTPQMIINGTDHVVGNRPKDVEFLIDRRSALPLLVQMTAEREGDRLTISAEAEQRLIGDFEVRLIRYMPKQKVAIKSGENAGEIFNYAQIVTDMDVLKKWDGRNAVSITTQIEGDEHSVVLIQREGHGEIVAATRVD